MEQKTMQEEKCDISEVNTTVKHPKECGYIKAGTGTGSVVSLKVKTGKGQSVCF